MNKRGFMYISLLILVILVATFPITAQDTTPEAASALPTVCTTNDFRQITAQTLQTNRNFSVAVQAGSQAHTPDELTTNLIALGKVYQGYFNDNYPKYPKCIDGVIIGNMLGELTSVQITYASSALLNVEKFDPDINRAIQSVFVSQRKLSTDLANNFVIRYKQVAAWLGLPNWFSNCTADQLDAAKALPGLEQTWLEQVPMLQSYLDGGSVDKPTYLTLANLVVDYNTLVNSTDLNCAQLYDQVANDFYIFNNSFTALTIGMVASSISDNADFTTLENYFKMTLNGYITSLITHTPLPTITPTPTPNVPDAHVDISADQTTVHVGDTVTITGVPVSIGLSIFTLNLSSGLSVRVRYDNQKPTIVTTDPLFEVVSVTAEMNRATFVLRALSAGTTDATISASGEVSSGGVYSWSFRTSTSLTLTVAP